MSYISIDSYCLQQQLTRKLPPPIAPGPEQYYAKLERESEILLLQRELKKDRELTSQKRCCVVRSELESLRGYDHC